MANTDMNGPIGLDARICNPFNDKEIPQMDAYLEEFMMETGIEKIYRDHFRRGMYIAQHPNHLDDPNVSPHNLSLEPFEQEYLKLDKIATTDDRESSKFDLKKWSLPSPLWRLVTLCALGAAVQGWDQSAVNSAQIYYQDAFKIWIFQPEGTTLVPEPWLVGLVNSAPYLCCVLSCWFTHPLNHWFGRRWTIFISCLFSAAWVLAQSFANSWQIMFAFRLLLGLGIGPKSATIPIYAAEAAPRNVRGGLVMMWQVFTAFGIMCGYVAGVAFQNVLNTDCPKPSASNPILEPAETSKLLGVGCSLKWRLMIGSPLVAPIILMMYVFTQPESPRWSIGKGHECMAKGKIQRARSHYQEAFEALVKLRHTKIQAARDMFLVYYQLKEQKKAMELHRRNASWYEKGVFELLTNRRNRRAFIASLTCMFAQQFCGVNVIVYYSGEVLSRTKGVSAQHILLFSMGFGIINFLFALPAFYTIDTLGRRSLLLITFPFLALFQLFTAIAFMGPDTGEQSTNTSQGVHATSNTASVAVTRQWPLAIIGMYLFGVAYSPGEGPVPFVYSAESMPLYIRDIGMGCVTSVNWFFNWLIAITAPKFFEAFQSWGAFLWYAVWCVVLWFMIFFFVPETRMLSLEQLDSIFNQRTQKFWHFAIHEEAVWFWKRWIRRDPNAGPRPQLHEYVQRIAGDDEQQLDLTTSFFETKAVSQQDGARRPFRATEQDV